MSTPGPTELLIIAAFAGGFAFLIYALVLRPRRRPRRGFEVSPAKPPDLPKQP
jgi:hypothetical protein